MRPTMPATSSRILYDIPCVVCLDNSSGKHYGVYACDGCAGFFKRSVRRDRRYVCKAIIHGTCIINKMQRNQCRFCRLAKCIKAGMNKDAVQHERGPRNSTIRRHMAFFSKDMMPPPMYNAGPDIRFPINISNPVMPNPGLLPPHMPLGIFPNPYTAFAGFNPFNTPPGMVRPPFVPPILPTSANVLHNDDPEKQCEVAARLLFLNVKWAKSVVPFESLSLADRLLLLEESWAELFVLGVAQHIYPIDLKVIYERGWSRIDRAHVENFESVLAEIANLKPHAEEYIYLCSLILFKTNFTRVDMDGRISTLPHIRRLQDLPAVADVQSRIQTTYNMNITTAHAAERARASQLHQILSLVRTVSGHTIIELFFRNTIGDITVERIITDMYQSGRIPVIPINI